MANVGLTVYPDDMLDSSSPILSVTVGSKGARTFHVHKELICSSSEYFQRVTCEEWKDSINEQVSLVQVDPEVFEMYVHWLYRGTFPVRTDLLPDGDHQPEFLQLAEAHVLGEVLEDESFAEAAVYAMRMKVDSSPKDLPSSFPGAAVIDYIYKNSLPTSEARHFLVDQYVLYGRRFWVTPLDDLECFPHEFICGLFNKIEV